MSKVTALAFVEPLAHFNGGNQSLDLDPVRNGVESRGERLVRLLTERSLTLAVAESCTGGLICHLLTNVPGSSRCFLGGVVAYDGRTKTSLLGVGEHALAEQGSVSPETALAMAEGVRERLESDLAVAVTGIAGPGGGTPEKPVGTVYLALVARHALAIVFRERFEGDRESYKYQAAARALQLIEDCVSNNR